MRTATLQLCIGLAALALVAGCGGVPSPTATLPPTVAESPAPPTPHPLPEPPSVPPGAGLATPEGGGCPPDHPIKGRVGPQGERWYYLHDSANYAAVVADVCFATLDGAHEAGYGPPPE